MFFLGIDFGTSGVRATIINNQKKEIYMKSFWNHLKPRQEGNFAQTDTGLLCPVVFPVVFSRVN